MPDYWLDSNVFIEGKKGPYGFDIAPRFWSLIDESAGANRLSCPGRVCDELMDGQDDLAAWAQERRASSLFVEPGVPVQEAFGNIVAYVTHQYPDTDATRRFLDRADPWVIAHAVVDGGTVVTLEIEVPANSRKVKIPNVCNQLGIRSINTYQMLRELGVSWNT